MPWLTAQRRPGREPRRHSAIGAAVWRGLSRSTKAGARTPATLSAPSNKYRASQPLNEGRGANPGDTRDPQQEAAVAHPRSTKAGARTPATRRSHAEPDAGFPRSTKAGARTPATPAASPATGTPSPPLNEGRGANPGDTCPAAGAGSCWFAATLNEGRGANPGDTSPPSRATGGSRALNEGRGANPGDTFF